MSCLVAFPIVFTLFYDPGRQAGMLKLMKKAQILVLVAVWVFLRVFGQVKGWIILKMYEMIRVQHIFDSQLFLFFFVILVGREECSNL